MATCGKKGSLRDYNEKNTIFNLANAIRLF